MITAWRLLVLMGATLFALSVQAQTRFVLSSDSQEVTDTRTGLIWRFCPEGMSVENKSCKGAFATYTHEQALQRAASQAVQDGKAWRVPNVKELSSLIDKTRKGPANDPIFSYAPAPTVPMATATWASNPYADRPSEAAVVDFYWGGVYSAARGGSLPVRLVRTSP